MQSALNCLIISFYSWVVQIRIQTRLIGLFSGFLLSLSLLAICYICPTEFPCLDFAGCISRIGNAPRVLHKLAVQSRVSSDLGSVFWATLLYHGAPLPSGGSQSLRLCFCDSADADHCHLGAMLFCLLWVILMQMVAL